MPNRSRARGREAKKIVNYTWAGFSQIQLALGSGNKILLGSFALSTAFEETIVRTRGMMTVTTDQSAALEEQLGAFGLIIVSDRAITAGAASIPGPFTDADDDGWLVWQPFAQLMQSAGFGSNNSITIDSKAQRIVREGEQVAVMLENGSGTDGIRFELLMRVLSRFRS